MGYFSCSTQPRLTNDLTRSLEFLIQLILFAELIYLYSPIFSLVSSTIPKRDKKGSSSSLDEGGVAKVCGQDLKINLATRLNLRS